MIIDELLAHGVTHYYLSPGMRNAPLIAALNARKQSTPDQLDFFVVMDERSAAFRAMGHAKKTGRPAVLICTSGTALANYMPAVVEAWKIRLPMIVLSADRPPELNASDANQTIIQDNIYGNYVAESLNLGVPTESISPRALRTSVANIVTRAMRSGPSGPSPVHLNLSFREPLDGTSHDKNETPLISHEYLEKVKADCNFTKNSESKRSTHYTESYAQVPNEVLEQVVEKLNQAQRAMFVLGELPPWIDRTPISETLKKLNIPLFLDVGSSLKYEHQIPHGAPSFDHPEVFEQYRKSPPKLIIHLGGRIVARHYYELLAQSPDIFLISVNDSSRKEDPSHQIRMRLVARPDIFCANLNKLLTDTKPLELAKNFQFEARDWKSFIQQKSAIIDESKLSYPVISKTTIETIPEDSTLYLGNSTVIRSFDSYASDKVSKRLHTITHRGASGIEGFVSAAIGHTETKFFLGDNSPTTLVLGDVSAIHDLNAFIELKNKKIPLIIVIVNNQGGGIFTLLPMKKDEHLIKSMLSPHDFDFHPLINGLGVTYLKAQTRDQYIDSYKQALQKSMSEQAPIVIEACFNHEDNREVYKKLRTIRLN